MNDLYIKILSTSILSF